MTTESAFSDLPDLVAPETARRYERWLAEQPGDDGYLYTDARVRFDVRDGDVVVGPAGLVPRASSTGTVVEVPSLGQDIEIAGIGFELVARFFAALDGERTLAEAKAAAGLGDDAVRTLVDATFGVVLFAPFAVSELERAVTFAEIVRFPGSPYEVPRNYWQNMAAVRRGVPRLLERVTRPSDALEELRGLHAVALLGNDETSFYRPASPIAKKGVFPSRLWLAASRTVETEAGTRFLEGPRVGARFLGGERYGTLLSELAGDRGATSERLEHRDESGLAWGRIVVARADTDSEAAPWFCPPRPFSRTHVESLFESLARAIDRRHPRSAVEHLADFHQKFMRLHPFRAANQALAMSIVNAVLAEARDHEEPGGGIPHLILDHLAFRLAPEAYRRVFALAAREWRVFGSPAERARRFGEHKKLYYRFVERLANARDDAEARAIARDAPLDARLALLLPGRNG